MFIKRYSGVVCKNAPIIPSKYLKSNFVDYSNVRSAYKSLKKVIFPVIPCGFVMLISFVEINVTF
jgi:hypothetical protein